MSSYKIIAKIHIELANRGISREAYTEILHTNFGKTSCKELDYDQKAALLEIIKNTKSAKMLESEYQAEFEQARFPSEKQIKYIAYLCKGLGWSKRQGDDYIKKHFGLSNAGWMTSHTARAVITGMLNMQRIKQDKGVKSGV